MRPEGLYCPSGDFYVDPWRPVPRAVITHAHSDHARAGSGHYLCAEQSVRLLRDRLGTDIDVLGLEYGQCITVGSVRISLHPAGHMLGSSQVCIELAGHRSVITGDYKRDYDSTCHPFEPVRAHVLITESTFGLPVFRWPSVDRVLDDIHSWWRDNQSRGTTSMLYAYAAGKSQRILSLLEPSIGPIFVHGALLRPTEIYRQEGVALPTVQPVGRAAPDTDWSKAMVLAVPSAHGTTWVQRFRQRSSAMASGWMQIRGNRRRRAIDRGFVLSDHADWPGLLQTIHEVQPEDVYVTHGFSDVVSRHLTERGIPARPLVTEFVGESPEDAAADSASEADENMGIN